ALRLGRIARLAERAQRIGDRHTALVGAHRRAVRQPAERRARAEQADAESRALLVAPPDDLDRTLESDAVVEQRIDGLHRAEHAEGAVEAAALRDGVDVRTDQDRGRASV